jgi:hypothetical protein
MIYYYHQLYILILQSNGGSLVRSLPNGVNLSGQAFCSMWISWCDLKIKNTGSKDVLNYTRVQTVLTTMIVWFAPALFSSGEEIYFYCRFLVICLSTCSDLSFSWFVLASVTPLIDLAQICLSRDLSQHQ